MELTTFVTKPNPFGFKEISLTVNGGEIQTATGIEFVNQQSIPLPFLPTKVFNRYVITYKSVRLCEAIDVVSNKERSRRQRKLDFSSRVTRQKRNLELKKKAK